MGKRGEGSQWCFVLWFTTVVVAPIVIFAATMQGAEVLTGMVQNAG